MKIVGKFVGYFVGIFVGSGSPAGDGLYNWWAASHANIAPVGYSVPTDTQWTTLTDYITAEIAASRLPDVGVGNVLKSQRQDPEGNANVIIQTTTDPYWQMQRIMVGIQ